jgi:hypothetical protein
MSANTLSLGPAIVPEERSFNRIQNINWRRWAIIPGFAVVIATAACAANSNTEAASSSPAAPTSAGCVSNQDPNAQVTKRDDGAVQITFDSLCSDLSKGGSNVINVYPDANNPSPNGTFMDGQQAFAQCKEESDRVISSVPDQGELEAHSQVFFELADNNSQYHVTAVYVENRDAVAAALPDCLPTS